MATAEVEWAYLQPIRDIRVDLVYESDAIVEDRRSLAGVQSSLIESQSAKRCDRKDN